MTDPRLALARDFLARAGWGAAAITPLAGDASARRYFRLAGGAVLMDADPARGESVDRFLQVGRWLLARAYSAPRILATDEADGFLLLEDLGDDLFAHIARTDPACEAPIYLAATGLLADLHRQPPPGFLAPGDGRALARLVQLLDDVYLPATGAAPLADLPGLIADLYDQLTSAAPVLSMRDFHAENLLWLPERSGLARVGLLDFQDAFATDPAYDLVSLLQDARRDLAPGLERTCIRAYLDLRGLGEADFMPAYALIGAQRGLRLVAVLTKLCLKDGKPRYLDFLPRVWANLQRDLDHPALRSLAEVIARELPEPDARRLKGLRDKCPINPAR